MDQPTTLRLQTEVDPLSRAGQLHSSERLKGIALFVQAVDAGSFALAAERQGLSRSEVGKSIARLENRLGVRLFHRTTRSLSLTEDGAAYHASCMRVPGEIKGAELAMAEGHQAA